MYLSFYDEFTTIDWENIALSFGKVTCIGSIVSSIISLTFQFDQFIGFYTLFIGLFIGIWEFPILYSCFPIVDRFKEIILNSLYLQILSIRGVVYILLSIICLLKSTICLIAGLLFLINSILLFLGSIYKHIETTDALFTEDDFDDEVNNNITRHKEKFGTF